MKCASLAVSSQSSSVANVRKTNTHLVSPPTSAISGDFLTVPGGSNRAPDGIGMVGFPLEKRNGRCQTSSRSPESSQPSTAPSPPTTIRTHSSSALNMRRLIAICRSVSPVLFLWTLS
jgi:hypothetical protein